MAASRDDATGAAVVVVDNAVVVPSLLVDGLTLDVTILQSLLKRHRCNHGRTLYYRRMEMALKSIRGSKIFESIQSINTTFSARVKQYQQLQRQQQQKRQRYEQRSKKKVEEQWTLSTIKGGGKGNVGDDCPPNNHDPLTLIWNDLRGLIKTWTSATDEIISRIHHASRMLFVEVSRGFFLPFCSVALASLARIRALMMEIGQLCLSYLHNLQKELHDVTQSRSNDAKQVPGVIMTESQFCHYMGIYMEGDEPTTTLASRINTNDKNGVKFPDVDETLAMLGLPRSSSFMSKSNKRKATSNNTSKDQKKRKKTTDPQPKTKATNHNTDESELLTNNQSFEQERGQNSSTDKNGDVEGDVNATQNIDIINEVPLASPRAVKKVAGNGCITNEKRVDVMLSAEKKQQIKHDDDNNDIVIDGNDDHDEIDQTRSKKKVRPNKEKKIKKKKKKKSSSTSSGDNFFDKLFS